MRNAREKLPVHEYYATFDNESPQSASPRADSGAMTSSTGGYRLPKGRADPTNSARRENRRKSRRKRLERILYRTAGLPVALRLVVRRRSNGIGHIVPIFVRSFWRPQNIDRWAELVCSILLLPLTLPAIITLFTARNGATICERHGIGILRQIAQQLRLYLSAGILPPWYYMFELYLEPTTARALSYIQRFETHEGVYAALRPSNGTPLNDKKAFADWCSSFGIPHVSYLSCVECGSEPTGPLPLTDLFVKPRIGRGGRGAERWDYVGNGSFEGIGGVRLTAEQLIMRLGLLARGESILVQPFLMNHRDVRDLSTGALSTVRILTCLDEENYPQFIGAAFRMSIGSNRTVDNFHAGGIACAVSRRGGTLCQATDAGLDASLGWLSVHPDTGAMIEGRSLPFWEEVKSVAVRAHRAFNDRKLIGWDIAILDSGPIVVEGNSSADLDILQRTARAGLAKSRLDQLMAFHIGESLRAADLTLPRPCRA